MSTPVSTPVKLAIVYYSSTGTITEIAKELHDAAAKAGAQVRLLKAAELAAPSAIDPVNDTTRTAARIQAERVVRIAARLKTA